VNVLERTAELLASRWPVMLALAVVPVLLGLGAPRLAPHLGPRTARGLEWALLVAALGLGLWFALERASVVDDAFISLRYARNLVEGHGLVWNLDERVEGYTNFLWTVLVAAVMALTGADPPWIALVGSLLCFVANLVVITRLGRRLAAPHGPRVTVPIATLLLACQLVFSSYGTSGLETMASSLFVTLGASALLGATAPRGAFVAGSMLILATFTRPDHSLFYAVGGLVLLAEEWRRLRSGGLRVLVAYAAPALVYAAYLGWKLQYYGHVLPNTFYAKSAGETYVAQGWRYAVTFYLGSHLWLVLVPFAVWALSGRGDDARRRFRRFAGLSVLVYNAYVLKIGGDFMLGRFYVSTLPLILLGLEEGLYAWWARTGSDASWRRLAPWAAAGLLFATARGGSLVRPNKIEWGIADESTFYDVRWRYPLEIDHGNYRVGNLFGRTLADRGIDVTLATSGIGMAGFYSRLELIDLLGLTDETIAHAPLRKRGRPGHEKRASRGYLVRRGVDFIRKTSVISLGPPEARAVAQLRGLPGRPWFILRYDRDLMRQIAREAPEIRFVDFEVWLDRYVAALDRRSPGEVREDLGWLRRYYFDHNDDPGRQGPIEARAAVDGP
jgi:arabinofuranosyltransferase